MTDTISTKDALRDLGGEICRGCGGRKKRRMSHCRKCYFSLPENLRSRLYRVIGDGYEQAYAESLGFLQERRNR